MPFLLQVDESRDAFPLGSKNTISDTTTPSFTLNNRNYDGSYVLHSQVKNISVSANNIISFDYVPDPLRATTSITMQSVSPGLTVEAVYNLQGVKLQSDWEKLPTGIYLVRYSDGTVRKVTR